VNPSRYNLSALAVRERAITLFFMFLTAAAGTIAFLNLGQAEDPAFTVRVMVVSAIWPGASAEQMQRLVADPLEKRIREVEDFYKIETTAHSGRVDMLVEFQEYTPAGKVPDRLYQVRKRMQDSAPELPAGVLGPFIDDEFSDVYFALYAISAPGLPHRDLIREAEGVRDALSRIAGIQKVRVLGERPQRIYAEFDNARLSTLGLTPEAIADALEAYNRILPGGLVETRGPRIYLRLSGELEDLDAIRRLPLRVGNRIIQLGEVAQIRRGYKDPPNYLVRANTEDAVLLGIVMQRGFNGLDLGKQLAAFQQRLSGELPLGLNFKQMTNQSDAIAKAVGLFQVKFFIAVSVVMVVTLLSLGLRAGLIVGIAIPLTLALTFLAMLINGINLDRITLGALIIALGLLVDDAIIAIETMVVKMKEGWERTAAAAHAWTVTAAPMLSGTLVTVIGFVPIGFAQSSVGEYAGNIFWVLAFALTTSWLVAVIFTPYLGVILLPDPKRKGGGHEQIYQTWIYRFLRWLIAASLRFRWQVVIGTFVILVLAVGGLVGPVQKQFFPASDRPEVLVDVYLPEGSSIRTTDEVVRRIERVLNGMSEVRSLSAYVGAGAPRFFIALNPEQPNTAFAKIIAVTGNAAERDRVIGALRNEVDAGTFPEARVRVQGLLYGPPIVWPVTFRVFGPDLVMLREVAERVRKVIANNPNTVDPHLEWGQRVPIIRIKLEAERLRSIGLTQREIARQLQFELDGMVATEIREDIRNVQLVLRGQPSSASPRRDLINFQLKTLDGRSIPLAQVGEFVLEFEDPVLKRYNRETFIAVNADVMAAQPADVTTAIWNALEIVRAAMPKGYRIEIGGSAEQSQKGNASIEKVQPIMIALMLTMIMLQMRSFAGTLMVVATAPLGIIGAVLALIVFDQPFGFVALLGLIGLAGILIRNTLILAMQFDDNVKQGMDKATALIEATVRRARPVILTALAAALAFIPLATDSFWGPLAYVLIGGVSVGTAVTLLFLPALYSLWFRIKPAEYARSP